MAWKGRRRRRQGTQWMAAPTTLSRRALETPVQSIALRNLSVAGSRTGTLASQPQDLMKFVDDITGATAEHLNEGSVESRSFLRLVGMFRPLRASKGDAQGVQENFNEGCEVRYAIYRGSTQEDEADYDEGPGTLNIGFADQPDLWLSTHLGSERLAFFRSFLLPRVDPNLVGSVESVLQLGVGLTDQLPWWYDAALTVIDLRSKRKVSTDSKLYLLRQVRFWDADTIGDGDAYQSANLYHADLARLLARKVRA